MVQGWSLHPSREEQYYSSHFMLSNWSKALGDGQLGSLIHDKASWQMASQARLDLKPSKLKACLPGLPSHPSYWICFN